MGEKMQSNTIGRGRSEESLMSNQNYLKVIQDSMQVGLFLIDASSHTIADVNKAALKLINLHREDVIGKPFHHFMTSLNAGQVVEHSEQILINGQGLKIPIMTTAVAIDFDHKPYIVETFIDISEQKKAQEIIAENEKMLRSFLESTSSIPWELDLTTGRFIYMGPQIEKILGYPVDSWKDISVWRSRLHPDDQKRASEYCAAETVKGNDHDFTYRALHADGSYRWIRDVVSVVSDSTGPKKLLGFMQDITAQKNLEYEKESIETRLRQAQKMEAIGALAGGIAHDFNNILAVIIGTASMAIDDYPRDCKIIDDLNRILAAGNRAKDLVRQILAFSRQSEVERIPLSPLPIIKESLKMLRASIPSTINIEEDIQPNCGTIVADPTQLHQILMNLCTNAYHAMEEKGGTLSVVMKTSENLPPDFPLLPEQQPADFIELTVKDTGCGMSQEIQDKIFEPFFTTKPSGKGTGMGLSITYGIVHGYGGTITVDSQPGKGTTFHLYLPKCQQAAGSEERLQDTIPKGHERILFVDDEEFLCELSQDMLKQLGYTVMVQQRSIGALEEFMNHPYEFDLVITDQTMPGMTGMELSRQILQIRPDIPIILCTGFSHSVSEDMAKASGIKEFVLKPVTKGTIARLIRKILDESNQARQQP